MKMYAMRRIAYGYTTGKSGDFNTVPGFDKENVALSCNKDTQTVLELVSYKAIKGSYLYNKDIEGVKSKLISLNAVKASTVAIVQSLIALMSVCQDKGYDIRFW